MFLKINGLYLNKDLSQKYKIINNPEIKAQNEKILLNLSKINLFVGANNSGKSRFIRNIFAEKDLPVFHNIQPIVKMNINEIDALYVMITESFDKLTKKYSIAYTTEFNLRVKGHINQIKDIKYIEHKIALYRNFFESMSENIQSIENYFDFDKSFNTDLIKVISIEFLSIYDTFQRIIANQNEFINFFAGVSFENNKPNYQIKKIYIPALRGLRHFDDDENRDVYSTRTLADYFTPITTKENWAWKISKSVFTGLTLYETTQKYLLGDLSQRKLIREYEIFLSKSFFDKKEITLIPSLETKVLNIKIGNEKEQPIYNLGDGLQSLIILTFPLFLYQEDHLLLFIEEPELFLHPGMQRLLLEVYSNERFKHVQFFIATHSNHLLDISMDMDDISIFSVHKNEINEKIEEDLPSFTVHNIEHFSFLDDEKGINEKYLCGKLLLIADKDEGKDIRHEELRKMLGDNFKRLDRIEIENIISEKILKAVLIEFEKDKNADKIESINYVDYENVRLGCYIDNLLDVGKKYSADSGTLTSYYKREFCKKVIKQINDIHDLSIDAINLCEIIYKFIDENNS